MQDRVDALLPSPLIGDRLFSCLAGWAVLAAVAGCGGSSSGSGIASETVVAVNSGEGGTLYVAATDRPYPVELFKGG